MNSDLTFMFVEAKMSKGGGEQIQSLIMFDSIRCQVYE